MIFRTAGRILSVWMAGSDWSRIWSGCGGRSRRAGGVNLVKDMVRVRGAGSRTLGNADVDELGAQYSAVVWRRARAACAFIVATCRGQNRWRNCRQFRMAASVGDQVNRTMLVNVLGLDGIIALTSGRRQTCALTTSGAAWCWGSNAEGQLGTGTDTDSSVPVPVVGIPSAVALAAGGFHTCALVNGGVWCWGEGSSGQLGDGLNQASKLPVHVVGLDDAVAIATGDRHSCALRKDGHVVCWGAGKLGQIGDGAEVDRSVPTEVQF